MIPDFAGKVIALTKIDFGLYLWTVDNWEILLAGAVLVSVDGQPTAVFDVDVADSPLPPELDGMVGLTITQLLVAEEGHLGLQVGNRQLTVRADDRYEAWQIAGHDGERLICTPGGELTYFPPVRPNPPAGDQ